MPFTEKEILDRFKSEPITREKLAAIKSMADATHELAFQFLKVADESRERSAALTKLEEFIMWAARCIAVNGVREQNGAQP